MADEGPLIIGVDVGGTNTDSVLLNSSLVGRDAVVASHKTATTPNVTLGVQATLRTLLDEAGIEAARINALALGTTHFINAIVERDSSRVEKVAVLRLASHNFSLGTPPFTDWPSALERIIHGYSAIIPGGCNINGTLIGEIDEAVVREHSKTIERLGIKNIVIVGIGSPSDERYHQEEQVRDIIRKTLGEGPNIICSKHIAGSGLLARENAAILNAAILNFAQRTIRSFIGAMQSLGLQCPLYLTSNAGHLLPFSEAVQFPIHIFSSGTTNSIRGAAFLAGSTIDRHGCIVVDIGGTTTDVGYLLKNGYPRLATSFTDIAGVKVNLQMPSTESIGLGGGSLLHISHDVEQVLIGPDSVGHNLLTEALCFGGKTATATDVVVARGVDIGIQSAQVDLSSGVLDKAEARIKRMLETCIDRTKSSPEPCTVILVGGGSILCPKELNGVNRIVVPDYAGVANAIGAAMAMVSGTAELIVKSSEIDESRLKVKDRAIQNCVAKGGDSSAVTIINEEVSGVPYTQGQTLIRVEVACPANHKLVYEQMLNMTQRQTFEEEKYEETKAHHLSVEEDFMSKPPVNLKEYRPDVSSEGLWTLSEIDIRFMAIGCYILGCGGGGSPYEPYLHLRHLLSQNDTVTMVRCENLGDDDVIPPIASSGTPAVSIERPGGNALLHSLQAMSKELNVRFDKILATEIGGGNGLAPMVMCSTRYYGIPLVDGDLMGRAYPNFEMVSQYVSAKSINELLPVTLSSGTGENITIPANQVDETSAGIQIRDACFSMGFAAGGTGRPLSGKEIRAFGIPNTHSLAWRLGRVVAIAQDTAQLSTVAEALIDECGGPRSARRLFQGKIRSVESSITKTAHTLGKVTIEVLAEDEMETSADNAEGLAEVTIPYMNENLAAIGRNDKGEEIVLATVPDLIFLLDVSTGEAIGCQEYRYGLKVTVMVMAPHPVWASKRGLEIAGPRHFDLPYDYTPTLTYTKPRSVIDEYRKAI